MVGYGLKFIFSYLAFPILGGEYGDCVDKTTIRFLSLSVWNTILGFMYLAGYPFFFLPNKTSVALLLLSFLCFIPLCFLKCHENCLLYSLGIGFCVLVSACAAFVGAIIIAVATKQALLLTFMVTETVLVICIAIRELFHD